MIKRLLGIFHIHTWNAWGPVVDTGCHIHRAQFRCCEKCHAIRVRYITLWKNGNSCPVPARTINESV